LWCLPSVPAQCVYVWGKIHNLIYNQLLAIDDMDIIVYISPEELENLHLLIPTNHRRWRRKVRRRETRPPIFLCAWINYSGREEERELPISPLTPMRPFDSYARVRYYRGAGTLATRQKLRSNV